MFYQLRHLCLSLLLLFFSCSTYALEVAPDSVESAEQYAALTTTNISTVTLDLLNDTPEKFQDLLAKIPETFFVQELNCNSDVYIEDTEKEYVLGFTKESCITRQQLLQASSRFKMKNKYATMTISCIPHDNGFDVTIDLVGLWTFNKVIVRGLLRGAEKYHQCYLLEFGELFDKDKHQHSIEKIKEAFNAEGFFNGKVHDYLEYDNKTKQITVTLVLDTGYQFKINDVIVSINYADDNAALASLLKKLTTSFVPRLKGFYYTQTIVNNETNFLKHYVSKKGYLNSIITLKKEFDFDHDTIKLLFSITLREKKAIAFFGNHFFSSKELYDLIFAFGRSTALLPDSFLSQEIIDAYQKKGFWHVEVNCKQEEKRTYFLIKEGQRIVIDAIEFIGVTSFTPKVINNFFSSFKKNAFDEETLRHALQKVVNFYLKEGFIDVKIIKQEYIPTQKPDVYTLLIDIDEGNRRYFKSAVIDKFPELSLLGPFAAVNKEPALPFDVNQIQVQRQWLMNHFQQMGYLYVDAKPEIIYEDTKVAVVWKISGIDQKVTFGKTIILGSHTFPFENIVRELPFKEGDVWQKEKLDQALKQLRRLNIFENIYLYPYNITQQEKEKAIIVKLSQDDPFEVRVRAGFQQVSKTLLEFRSGTTYKLGGTFLYKNPFNAGDCFCIDTDFTRFYRNVSVEYCRPWFFSMPLNTIVKGYSNKYIQPVFIGSDKPLYQAIQQGFLISVNRCCCDVNYGCNVGLEIMETNDLSIEMAQAINFITTLIDKKVPYLYIEPNLVLDYLDNDVNPSHGTLTVVACKAMMPLRSISTTYFKFLFEQVAFLPLSVISSVFGFRFKVGHIFNQEFSNIMPPDRFYLGGQNSLRSYEPDKGPPLGSFIEKNGKRVLVPQGGRTMFNMNLELRFPLFWNIGGVVFQDIGLLAQHSLTEVIKSHFLAGTGFGLRYYTPVGPLRFDIGWKWRKFTPEESRYAWFLTLGHAF